ncbi:MAG: SPOR domain-containing protein, partial [Burkholderiaceae bacterium]|nr:SPOR domain-containing protein [Burkholderiaceae bacterium]
MDLVSANTPALPLDPAPHLTPDAAPGNAITTLSQLALGPVNTAYYVAVFERFDSTGRTPTTWNWAASLFTLSWMVFRRLWGAALAYVAAAQGLALLILGIGRYVLQWSQTVEWGVLGAFALLAFAVPGMYGNAWLYTDVRKRVDNALAASRTMPEARALLTKKGSPWGRLQVLVLLNAVAAAIAVFAYLILSRTGSTEVDLEPAMTVAQASAAAQAKVIGAAAAPDNTNADPLEEVAATQAVATFDTTAPATAPPTAVRDVLASTGHTAAEPAQAPARPTPPSTPDRAPVTAPSPASPEQPTRAAIDTREAAKRPAQSVKPKVNAAHAIASHPVPSAAHIASGSPDALVEVGTAPGYYINVGLFGQEANARRTQARLLNEGLPAYRQAINGPNGSLIRVRVGPYKDRSAANAA